VSFEAIAALAAVILGYAFVSERLAGWSVSGPLVFVVAGVVLGPSALGIVGGDFDEGGVELLAKSTLVLILFVDATRIDLRVLRKQLAIPARMLGVGLPLTVIVGTLIGAAVLTDLTLLEAALVAAILAPTDAALGQAVVSDKRVPVRIRQGLNVESGLNDGLMLPVIAILTAFAASDTGLESTSHWVEFVSRQIGLGVLFGVVVGAAGGLALDYFVERGWVEGALRQIGTLAVAVGAFAAAEIVEGNGFVAAFVAGLAFGYVAKDHCGTAADFTEDQGQLLALLTFLFFGALLVGPRIDELTFQIAVYTLLSLTAIRMIPVAISLIGMRLEAPTIGYLSWFGPRGLASILFGLFVVENAELAGSETILAVVTWTVLASVVVHGLTAVPFTRRYVAWWQSMTPDEVASMPEGKEVEEMRPRMTM
jgi:NhaP-type Na+/H+ or K+/H+ antiporter